MIRTKSVNSCVDCARDSLARYLPSDSHNHCKTLHAAGVILARTWHHSKHEDTQDTRIRKAIFKTTTRVLRGIC